MRGCPPTPPVPSCFSIPKARVRQHPHCAPFRTPSWCRGGTDGLQGGAVSSQKGLGAPALPHPLPTLCSGTVLLTPSFGKPPSPASSRSCIPHARRVVAPIRDLTRGHGDPQAKSSSFLQTETSPWAKPSRHPQHPILGARAAPAATLQGTLSPQGHRGAAHWWGTSLSTHPGIAGVLFWWTGLLSSSTQRQCVSSPSHPSGQVPWEPTELHSRSGQVGRG